MELIYNEDLEVMRDACLGLSYLTDGAEEHIQLVIEYGNTLFSRLDKFLRCGIMSVTVPAIRTICNIVSGYGEQMERVIESGLLYNFPALLQHPNISIQEEAIKTISIIADGWFFTYGNSYML